MNVFDNISVGTHAVCESSLLHATEAGPIYSLKMHANADNGTIVALGSYVGNQVFNSKAYAAGSEPLLVLSVPTGYNTALKHQQDEKYFYNAAGEIARAYQLHVGDIWTVSESMFNTATPAVGKYIDATYKVTDTAGSTGMVAQIIDKVVYQNSVSYRVHLIKTGV